MSALMAAKNITGPTTAFEGQACFFKTCFHNDFNRENMLDGLGLDFLGSTTLYKPWPAVGPAHSHIHATIQLVSSHDLGPDDVDRAQSSGRPCRIQSLCEGAEGGTR